MGFGVELKELLKQRGMTIKELSDITGISLNTLYAITKRDSVSPSNEIVKKIYAALQITNPNTEYTATKENLEIELNKLGGNELQIEDSIRKLLFDICNLLDSFALLELTQRAMELLEDDKNRSSHIVITSKKED